MIMLALVVLSLIFGIGAVFAFAAKVFVVTIIGGLLALGTLFLLLRHAFEDQRT